MKRKPPFKIETDSPFSSLGGKDGRQGQVRVELGNMFLGERKDARKQRDEVAGSELEF